MKKLIRLTERHLHKIIIESVNNILQEATVGCKFAKELDLLLQLASQGNMTIETASEKTAKTLYNRIKKCLDEINSLRLYGQEPTSISGLYDNVGGYETWRDIYYPKLIATHIIDENYKALGKNYRCYYNSIRGADFANNLSRQSDDFVNIDKASYNIEITSEYGLRAGTGETIYALTILPSSATNTTKNQANEKLQDVLKSISNFLGTYQCPDMLLAKLKYANRTYTKVTERQLQYALSVANEIMQTTPPPASEKQCSYIAYLLNMGIEKVENRLNKYQASELISAIKFDYDLPEEVTNREATINYYKSILN